MIASEMRFVRNGWMLTGFAALYFLVVWAIFLGVHHQTLSASVVRRPPAVIEPAQVEALARAFEQGEAWAREPWFLVRLHHALIAQGRQAQARVVRRYIMQAVPDNGPVVLQLALTLHNAGFVDDAEPLFSQLLNE